MVRHCECGARIKKDNVTGYCIKCYRANGSVITKKREKKDKPCYFCKEPKSEHKYMYCDDCRAKLSEEGGWYWGQMRGKEWGGDKVQVTPISEWKFR